MIKLLVFSSLVTVGIMSIENTDPTTGDVFTDITLAIPEPIALLLFGSVLIGIANVARKKVFNNNKRKGRARLNLQPAADSLKDNDRLKGLDAYVSEELGNK